MPATIYAPPEHIPLPDFDRYFGKDGEGVDAYFAALKEFEQKVAEYCTEHGQGNLRGKKWRYQIADGYACYVVYTTRPLALIQTSDDYSIPKVLADSLTATALSREIEAQERIDALFSKEAPTERSTR